MTSRAQLKVKMLPTNLLYCIKVEKIAMIKINDRYKLKYKPFKLSLRPPKTMVGL